MKYALTVAIAAGLIFSQPALAGRVAPQEHAPRGQVQCPSKPPVTDSSFGKNPGDKVGRTDDRPRTSRPASRHWARGQRVPAAYRGNRYVVNDWQARHLKRPSRGYHWVNVNNQYLLIAVATGLIGSLISDGQ